MSEVKVIDISNWNQDINYEIIKQNNVKAAILRVTERNNKIDGSFDRHYKGLKNVQIPIIGVYKFSYSLSLNEIKEEANSTIETLKKYSDFNGVVFLDLEWEKQLALGRDTLMKYAEEFRKTIVANNYKFGIYCSSGVVNSILDLNVTNYDLWLAAYSYNQNETIPERLRPNKKGQIGWQYTSNYPIGSNRCDMSVFDKDWIDKIMNNNEPKFESGGEVVVEKDVETITKEKSIDCIMKWLNNELGYLEKTSNASLDSKTGNAGYNNYTKYWRDVKPEWNGSYWCACFVCWIFMKAFGKDTATKIFKHWPYVYCPTLGALHTKYTKPEVGDIVLFYSNSAGEFGHTGVVVAVNGDNFETIEGNASAGNSVTPNGGGVVRKQYYLPNIPRTRFVRPDYSLVTNVYYPDGTSVINNNPTSSSSSIILKKGSTGSEVKLMQEMLIACGYSCGSAGADGDFGNATYNALISFQKDHGLEQDGIYGPASRTSLQKAYKDSQKQYGIILKIPGVIRTDAKKTAAEVITIGAGEKVEVLGKKTNSGGILWYKVKYGDKEGYIVGKNLKVAD